MLEPGRALRMPGLLMNNPPDVIDKEFVDRDPQKKTYKEMISSLLAPRILCIEAQDGLGKTWLLKRFSKDSTKPGWYRAEIDLGKWGVDNARDLLELIAKEMGGEIQKEMARANISGKSGVNITAGRDVNIKGDLVVGPKVMVNTPGGTEHLSVQLVDPDYTQHVIALVENFKTSLQKLKPMQWAILFLDNYEQSTKETKQWLTDVLLPGVKSSEYNHLIIIMTSTSGFEYFEQREWRNVVVKHKLEGLPEVSFREYWLKRRHLPKEHMSTTLIILKAEGMSPKVMSRYADMIEDAVKGKV